MTYYGQIQEDIEARIRSFVFHENLLLDRSEREKTRYFVQSVPEDLYEKAYSAMYREYEAAKAMHDALVASLPENARDQIRFEPYTPEIRNEDGDFPSTLAEWRQCWRRKQGENKSGLQA